MSIHYNIWGIDDTGYKQSIAGNLDPTTLTALQKSFSDKNRTIALDFASANPNKENFYSIEKRGNTILYTIYRSNWYRDARGAYDAVTIISSKSIENPISALKTLMNTYVAKKELDEVINLDTLLTTIKPAINEAPFRSVVKNGYIKYITESDLVNVFKNHRDTIKNFNKIYFFTSLPYLETGLGKIPNIANYKPIAVMVLNYDSNYHTIKVEGTSASPSSEMLEVYPGDKIEVYTGNSNSPAVFTASTTLKPISLKSKPIPPKPKKRKKRNSKDKTWMYLALALCSVVILVILGFFFKDNIKGLLTAPQSESWGCIDGSCQKFGADGSGDYSSKIDCESSCGAVENHKVVFDGEAFINMSTKDTIKDADDLLDCFKKSIYFDGDDASYTFDFGDEDWKIYTDKVERLKVDALKKLIAEIEKANQLADTKKIVDHINKVIQYTKLRFEGGLEDDDTKKIWKIDGFDLEYIISNTKSNTNDFTKFKKNIKDNKQLKAFLEKNLPKNIFDSIIKVHTEFKKNKNVNKTNKKQLNYDKPDCILTEKHKNNTHWNGTLNKFTSWSKYDKDTTRLQNLMNEESASIKLYENCGCSKCKTTLKDKNLIKVDIFIKNNK